MTGNGHVRFGRRALEKDLTTGTSPAPHLTSPRPPQPARPDPAAEHGRGLILVEHFSEQWRWSSFCTNLLVWTRRRQIGRSGSSGRVCTRD